MQKPRFEAEITPGMHVTGAVELGRAVEAAGFDRLGISCVALWHDTYQIQALIAAVTERIRIGSMVTNPYTRHIGVHASALATLNEVSNGRVFAGFGIGAGLEAFGMHYPQPVSTLREAIGALRALLRGESVSINGKHVALENAQLNRIPDGVIPIAVGTRSEGVMKLAGELADIVLIGARYLTPELVATYEDWLSTGASRAGRAVSDVETMARVTLCVSDDEVLAVDSVKRFAAHYLDILGDAGPPVAPVLREKIITALRNARGWYFDLDRYDPPELFQLVDPDLARAFAVVGTSDQCARQIRSILDMGFDGVSCNLAAVKRDSMYAGLAETIAGAEKMLKLL